MKYIAHKKFTNNAWTPLRPYNLWTDYMSTTDLQ